MATTSPREPLSAKLMRQIYAVASLERAERTNAAIAALERAARTNAGIAKLAVHLAAPLTPRNS